MKVPPVTMRALQMFTRGKARADIVSVASSSRVTSRAHVASDHDEEKPKPLALLCGWAACSEAPLKKYSKIYQQLGWEAHVFPGSIPLLWSHLLMYSSVNWRMRNVAVKEDNQPRDVIMHLFSSAPGFVLPCLLQAMSKHQTGLCLRGLVFDSSPTRISRDMIWVGARDRIESARVNPVLLGPPVAVTFAIDWLYNHLENTERRMHDVLSSPLVQSVPHLYLYSKADAVVRPSHIEKWKNYQLSRGVAVSSHVWDDSQHNKHFRKYPKEYTKLVQDFALGCVQ
ncbi:transmembrane protein 53-like [Corticium candelabrum]|uniref:transmembrane protein 53-like n=1 Tax=Corticium candelabrum TaxID=121492 RepID=UPI002E266334|nr:transmembrane protein 53-like [Corticium candelabrum]